MMRNGCLTLLTLVATLAACNDCDQAVRANPYDETRRCFAAEAQVVGCVAKGTSCPAVITVGVDERERCFAFPDCLPSGFTRAPAGGPCPTDGVQYCGTMASVLPFAPTCVRR
jgi:hypothetical protein